MQKGLIIVLFSMLCFSSKAQQIFVNGQNLTTLKNISYITVKVQKHGWQLVFLHFWITDKECPTVSKK